ncbi:MAG: translocation/assembly module TamB domain-containing protein [Sphingomonadaceae bacterium]
MAEETKEATEAEDSALKVEALTAFRSRTVRRLLRFAMWSGLATGTLLVLLVLLVNTPMGRQFIVDRIAEYAPESGMHFTVGRIEGNVLDEATLHDVVAYDGGGSFLKISEVSITWRPMRWFVTGLDIRELVADGGTLYRLPVLRPGDPDEPVLPGFDIVIEKLQIRNIDVAEGVAGPDRQRIHLDASVDIQNGRAYVQADGTVGDKDRLHALIDSEPDKNRFDIDLVYIAPRDGAVAALVGAEAGYTAQIVGDGDWESWDGAFLVMREDERFASFQLKNRAGQYAIVGQAYPGDVIEGLPYRALGETVNLALMGTLEDSVLGGSAAIRARGISGETRGTLDLNRNEVNDLDIVLRLEDPALFGENVWIMGGALTAHAEGPFRDLNVRHQIRIADVVAGSTHASNISQQGMIHYDGTVLTLPLDLSAGRIVTGQAMVDPRLVNGRMRGVVTIYGDQIRSPGLAITFPGAQARLAVSGDMARGGYALAGPVAVNNIMIDNVGTLNAGANIVLSLGRNQPWLLNAQLRGQIPRVTNATLANVAGSAIAFQGGVRVGGSQPLLFDRMAIGAPKLSLLLDGSVVDGQTSIAGTGSHIDYGKFTVKAMLADSGPKAELVFASPMPSLDLSNVRVAIAPITDGFGIETEGGSMFGPFNGTINLFSPANGPTRIDIKQFRIWKTEIAGNMVLEDGGALGRLAVEGGGLNGTISLAPDNGGGQGFDVALLVRNATFGGDTPLYINRARINGRGVVAEGKSTIQGDMLGKGIGYGSLFIGQMAGKINLTNGSGQVTASLTGQRGSQFALQILSDISPSRLSTIARGEYDGKAISMPRRAVMTRQDNGSWLLAPTQLNYNGGAMIAAGTLGGEKTAIEIKLSDMPLSLADLVMPNLALGGTISGIVDYGSDSKGYPVGTAQVQVSQLTRSGMILTSSPVDLSLVGKLDATHAETRAVLFQGGENRGRLQAQVTNLPVSGSLSERLGAGNLFGQLRYQGPAEALWRLAAIDAMDMTGPVSIAGNVTGSLFSPDINGTVFGDNLRIRSSLSGTDVSSVTVRGRFSGAQLRLTRIAGVTPGGGSVSGSGTVNLSGMGNGVGPGMDLKFSANNAQLLNAYGMKATVTGPMRMVSSGTGGTLAGRLRVNKGSWTLGRAATSSPLPEISTTEVNAPPDIAPTVKRSAPWRYLIDATAPNRFEVDGMGLDSEWSADISLRGTTSDPRIGGEAKVVRGYYMFAGNEFEITRGRIGFDVNAPINPRVDIIADTEADGLDVQASVQGSAMSPEITFTSTPALPEDEILSRLLFGGSVSELSPTDAIQLATTMASLQGGAGLNPINKLRSAIGLDRLRIVSADPAIGRGTGVAVGKNINRKLYAEIITDGQGYSATELEYRITSWLSLLATISTVGRNSTVLEISRDY